MNFVERSKPSTTITVMPRKVPYVLIHTKALQKMFVYTDECADEVGWLGTAYREGNEIHITDTFLFEQEVHATTTEITPEGLEKFGTELLTQENGVEVWNNLKMWGHSHVNMGITPSGQDDKQMVEFSQIGHDWFIRLICNKKGDLGIDVFDYEEGIVYKNVPWERLISQEEEEEVMQNQAIRAELQKQLDELDAQMKVLSTQGLEERKPQIKEEMTKKVRKKTYVSTYNSSRYGATAYGRYVGNVWKSWRLDPPTDEEMTKYAHLIPTDVIQDYYTDLHLGKKNSTGSNLEENEEENGLGVLVDEEDVYKYFDVRELMILSYSLDVDDLEDQMTEFGYSEEFSKSDLQIILNEAQSVGLRSGISLHY